MKRKPKIIRQGHSIYRNTTWGRLIDHGIYIQDDELVTHGKQIFLF